MTRTSATAGCSARARSRVTCCTGRSARSTVSATRRRSGWAATVVEQRVGLLGTRCRRRSRRRRRRTCPWWRAAAAAWRRPTRSPPSSSGMPSLPAWPMKAAAALPVSALTQRSTTVTPGRRPAARGRRRRRAGGLRRGLGLRLAQVAHAHGERVLDQPVVVLGDEGVHALLEQGPQQRVEGVVRLGEVDPRRPVAEVLQPGVAFGLGEQRAPDGVVLPRDLRRDLGQPLPGLALAARQQVRGARGRCSGGPGPRRCRRRDGGCRWSRPPSRCGGCGPRRAARARPRWPRCRRSSGALAPAHPIRGPDVGVRSGAPGPGRAGRFAPVPTPAWP